MKYSVLQNIKIKTSKGGLELLPGQVTALPYRAASKLLNEGKITPCDIALESISDEIPHIRNYKAENLKRKFRATTRADSNPAS